MARGWDSKAVEDQIGSAQTEKETASAKRRPTQRDRERQAQVDSLRLSRNALLNRLNSARNERYRAQLQLALEHIETKLRELGDHF